MTDQEKIDVIQAQIDGKIVLCRQRFDGGGWSSHDFVNTAWDFNFVECDYKVYVQPIVEMVEIGIQDAFRLLLASSGCGFKAQVIEYLTSDGGWKDEMIIGASYGNGYPFKSEFNLHRLCRVTKEVYNAR
jgi:hypothetical protein